MLEVLKGLALPTPTIEQPKTEIKVVNNTRMKDDPKLKACVRYIKRHPEAANLSLRKLAEAITDHEMVKVSYTTVKTAKDLIKDGVYD